MKILEFSDNHIHDDSHLRENLELQIRIAMEKPNIVVIKGDFTDEWEAPIEAIRLTETYRSWQATLETLATIYGVTIYRIPGNHDPDPIKGDFPHVTVVRKLVFHYPIDVEIRHGHEFDVIWSGVWVIPGISGLAFFFMDHFPTMARKLRSILHAFGKKTPRDKKGSYAQDWTENVGRIHNRARKHAQKTGRAMSIGHTHCPFCDGLVIDSGDMEDSFSYDIIEGSGTTIKKLVG